MAAVYAFVDAPGPTPTVLLNLDDNAPLTVVEGFSATPPKRRVSAFGSSAQNGDVVAQQAYFDRELKIPLAFKPRSTAEEQATAIQLLGRFLDTPQWLQVKHEGNTNPVFYRTKYGDITIVDEVLDGMPKRDLTMEITADPFGYGLPVTGSIVIENDPTDATRPMTYDMPTIQGDVATPLWFKLTQNAGDWATLISTTCLRIGATHGKPIFTGAFSVATAVTGWTITSTADATAVSGNRKRWSRASGVTTTDIGLTTHLANVPRGDYRLLIRCQASVADSTISAWVSDPSLVVAASPTIKTIPGTTYAYVDLGVIRAPAFGPRKTDLLDQGHATRTWITTRITHSGAGTIDLDEILLIPVGLDDALDTRTAFVAGVLTGTDDLYVDGVSKQTYLRVASTDTLGPAVMVGGGFPRVMPNAVNRLNLVRSIGIAGENKNTDTTVDWQYLPRYLTHRAAAT